MIYKWVVFPTVYTGSCVVYTVLKLQFIKCKLSIVSFPFVQTLKTLNFKLV